MADRARLIRIVVPAVVVTVAATIRLWGLPEPHTLVWDEQYYVFDAEVYLGGGIGQPIAGAPPVKISNEGTWVHPPLGKWIIALLGVGPLGMRSIGWRLPSALFGIAGVWLLYLLALRMWRSVWWAGFASLLLALDGLHVVQSRVAMLDIFLSTFVLAGFLFVVLDRERAERPDARRWPTIDRLFGSPYRLWAGLCLGAAVATKWSGMFALLLAAGLCAAWSVRGRRRDRPVRAAGTLLASFVALPIAVYLLSYGAFFYQHGPAFHDFLTLQLRMLRYQQEHVKVQPENSAAWTWPLLLHPVRYYQHRVGASISTIVALGNPVLWWGFLAALPFAIVGVVHRPTWQDAVAFGGYAAMFLPWFLAPRSQFIWYMLPAVPFMCLCLTATIHRARDRLARGIGIATAAAATVAAAAFAPIWTGWPVPLTWAHALAWLPQWPR